MEPPQDLARDSVMCASLDVADFDALRQAVAAAEQKFGGVDGLVNDAGIIDGRPFDQVSSADYEREVRTNLLGVLHGIKAVLAGMTQRKHGTIINVSSVSDRKTSPAAVAYTASKHAVRAVSESLREAEGKNGVRVINLAPDYVKTNILKGMGVTFEEYCRVLGNPDFLTAEELAEIILWCYRLPPHICVRDLVVAPTRSVF